MAAARPHLLVVDDEPEIGQLIQRFFVGQGFDVSTAYSGADARSALGGRHVDLVLLDLGLPDEDGLALLRDFQSRWRGPVIVVSGRGESVERIVGLELGADDYVTKPFDLRELLARVRSVLRRSRGSGDARESAGAERQLMSFAGFRLDVAARQLSNPDGQDVPLTTGDFDLLLTFLQHPNQVLSRDQLMNNLHGREANAYDRAIDVQIGRLRRKIEADPGNPQLIKSVRGAGYLFAARVQRT
jgi:two-component system OmpR family response regulator